MKIIRIGRNSSNDVVIGNDLKVSGTHCQIIEDDNGNYSLIDTNSTNGTYVNGVKSHGEVRLNQSDIIRIGNTTLPWQTYFYNPRGTIEKGNGYYGSGGNTGNPPRTKPDNFLVWAILVTIFFFFPLPLGIVSIVYASKVNGRWNDRNYAGAIEAARSARIWFWVAFGVGLFLYICYAAYYIYVRYFLFRPYF
jgi:hypothetical protein